MPQLPPSTTESPSVLIRVCELEMDDVFMVFSSKMFVWKIDDEKIYYTTKHGKSTTYTQTFGIRSQQKIELIWRKKKAD